MGGPQILRTAERQVVVRAHINSLDAEIHVLTAIDKGVGSHPDLRELIYRSCGMKTPCSYGEPDYRDREYGWMINWRFEYPEYDGLSEDVLDQWRERDLCWGEDADSIICRSIAGKHVILPASRQLVIHLKRLERYLRPSTRSSRCNHLLAAWNGFTHDDHIVNDNDIVYRRFLGWKRIHDQSLEQARLILA